MRIVGSYTYDDVHIPHFQDVVRVTNILARQLYAAGDSLLERATPVALTTNDLYCITKRLKLPLDSTAQTGIYNS